MVFIKQTALGGFVMIALGMESISILIERLLKEIYTKG